MAARRRGLSLVAHLEAFEVHPGLIGFAKHHGKQIGLGPALEVYAPLLVAMRLDQAEKFGVVLDRRFPLHHPDLNIAGRTDASTHLLSTFFHARSGRNSVVKGESETVRVDNG